MSIGAKWVKRAERAAAARASAILSVAERRLGELLPDAVIERERDALRITARRLVRRWIAEPALRFLAWSLK